MREHKEHRAQVLCSTTQPRWSLLFLSGGEPRQTEGYKHNDLKELNAPFVYMHVMLHGRDERSVAGKGSASAHLEVPREGYGGVIDGL